MDPHLSIYKGLGSGKCATDISISLFTKQKFPAISIEKID